MWFLACSFRSNDVTHLNIEKCHPKMNQNGSRRLFSVNSVVLDSPWRYSSVPRSSTMVLGSLGTELVRERRELERADPSIGSLVDCSHRSGDFPSSSCMYWKSEILGERGMC